MTSSSLSTNNKIDGILIVNKPVGPTSREVVNRVSKVLKTKKIGHTGTLDPLASGVLVLTIGKCTKLGSILTSEYKEYIASFVLGFETDTLDISGNVVYKVNKNYSKEDIIKAIMAYKGNYDQEVPAYSAVKVNGRRLYEYARKNEKIELPKREVTIKDIEIINIEDCELQIKTLVSKGTYIRSLIRDIGRSLNNAATMTKLVRTKQGKFTIQESFTLDDIENGNFKILSMNEILKDVHNIEMDEALYKKVYNGCPLKLDKRDEFLKFTYNNSLIALYKKIDTEYKMFIKFDVYDNK